jgi:D-alanyl-D-alanine carboxypeptidase
MMTADVARRSVTDAMLDTTVTVTAAGMTAGSLTGLQEGDVTIYRDLFYGLILSSGNDATLTLGRPVGGLIRGAEGSTGTT